MLSGHGLSLTTAVVDRRLPHGDMPAPYVLPGEFFTSLSGALTGPSAESPVEIAISYLREHAEQFNVTPADVGAPVATDVYTDVQTGITHVYLGQIFNGLEIANADANVNIAADGRVLSAGSSFTTLPETPAAAMALGSILPSSEALRLAGLSLGLDPLGPSAAAAASFAAAVFVDPGMSLDPIPAKPQYVGTESGLSLVWNFVLRTPDGEHWYDTSVDAYMGEGLWTEDWVDHATYNVYALPTESPLDGARSIVTDPADLTASPFGWHDTNGIAGAEFTDTRGNNVSAQDDTDANNSGGNRPSGGAGLNFDFPLDLGLAPSGYQPAAIANLFYWNNILHDVHYQYGFTEVAGNFQTLNYTGLGSGNDAVQADAQDGSGTNNANFATPPDGSAPRMQMYVFTAANPDRDGDLENPIVIHEYGHGVSNRLTGGPSNANALSAIQSGGMGEGWSDWWSLMLTMKPTDTKLGSYPVGNWVLNQSAGGAGIRRFPYSYDMAIDPLTLSSFNSSSEVHDAGEIWCSVLWDMAWNLIDKHGYTNDYAHGYVAADPTRNGGNNLALRLVMDALKLQPANPSFLQARDAIIQADQNLTGGANLAEIWTAFARRGFGFSANVGTANSTTVSQAFDLPPALLSPRVTSHTPSGVSAVPVDHVDFTFSRPIDASSFSVVDDVASFTGPGAVDLSASITGFSWINSTTLRVNFGSVSSDGAYTLVLGPQILDASNFNPLDQDADGISGEAVADQYSAAFRFDSQLLQVVSTVPANGSTVSLPLTTLDVNFNEPYDPASVGTGDLVLSQGSVTGFTLVDADTVQFSLTGISGETTLNFSIPASAITDQFGNPMGSYAGSLALDVGTVPLPVPFIGVSPLGGLIYQTTASTNLSIDTDVDSFTVALDAGQTITVIADPASGLQPILELYDPSSILVAGMTAGANGQDAVLQTVAVPAAGTYTITLRAAAGTSGTVNLQAVLNAAAELEGHKGPANNTLGTAQSIDASLISLGGTRARAALLGAGGANDDFYSINLVASDHVSFALDGSASVFQLLDASGNALAVGQSGSNSNPLIEDFVVPSSGVYVLRIVASAGMDYSLIVLQNLALDRGQNDNSGSAQDLSATGSVVGSGGGVGLGRMFVFDASASQIREANPQTGAIIRSFPSPVSLGGADFGLATTPTSILAGGNSASAIFEIDPDTGTTIRTLPNPGVSVSGIAFMNNEVFLLTDSPGGQITVLDYTTGAVARTITASGMSEDLGSDGAKLYGTSGSTLVEINPLTGAITSIGALSGGGSIEGLGFLEDEVFTSIGSQVLVYNRNTLAQVRSLTGFTNLEALGADGGGTDEDWYSINVLSGATVQAATSTPADGPGEFVNLFNAKLELYDPTGALVASDDNSAPDGRNATISHLAAMSGTYRIRVLSADSEAGDYVLSIQGGTAVPASFTATANTPSDGAVLTAAPTQVTIDFNDSLLLTSVDTTDLLVDGVPAATGVTVVDANTLTFTVSPVANGLHTVTIAAGSMVDLQQTGLSAFSSTFNVDQTPPRIIGSSIQQNDVLPAGSLTYTVTFDEPMNVANLDNSDVTLQGLGLATSYTPSNLSFNPGGTVLTVNYTNLPEDQYTLTLLSGNGRFEDLVGLDLDGEPLAFPLPPNTSGNGTAGGNFAVSFNLDTVTLPFPTPLTAQAPLGSLIYSGTKSTNLSFAADADSFTLSLDAGQTITVIADPAAGLQPIVELYDPASTLLGSVTAAAAGQDAVLQTIAVPTAGTYTITLRSAVGTGTTNVQVLLNAAAELEKHNGTDNSSRANAQSLDLNFLGLGGESHRAAVVGAGDGTQPAVFVANFESGSDGFVENNNLPSRDTGLWHVSIGHGTQSGHTATHSFYYGQGEALNGGGNYNTGSANAGTLTSPSIVLPDDSVLSLGFNYILQTEASPSFDLARLQISSDGGGNFTTLGSYNGSAEASAWTAATVDLSDYAGQTVQLRWLFDTVDANSNSLEGWYVDDVQISVFSPASDYYAVTLAAGDVLSLGLKGASTGLELQDSGGAVLAVGNSSATNVDRLIRNFVAPASGVYYVRVSPPVGTAYQLLANRNLDFDAEANNSAATAQDISRTGAVMGSVGGSGLGRLFVYETTSGGQIREVDPLTGTIISTFASPVAIVGADFGLATTPTSILAGSSPTAPIFEINPNTGATIRTLPNPGVSVSGIAFMNNEVYLLTDTPAGQITVLSYSTGAVLRTISAGSIITEDIGSDGTKLYGTSSSILYEINPLTGATTSLGSLSGSSGIDGLGFLDNEVYAAGSSNTVRVYNRATLAFVRTLSGFGTSEAVGADGGVADEDWFQVNVPEGHTLEIVTSTPSAGVGEFMNALDPRIELYDVGGALLASDDNSAPDGRNAQLSYDVSAAGIYRIRLRGTQSGEYVLTASTHPTPPEPLAADFDGDGDVDGADFVVWQTNFPVPSGATHSMGDADGDEDVDGADFVVWQTQFPTVASPGAVAPASAAPDESASDSFAPASWQPQFASPPPASLPSGTKGSGRASYSAFAGVGKRQNSGAPAASSMSPGPVDGVDQVSFGYSDAMQNGSRSGGFSRAESESIRFRRFDRAVAELLSPVAVDDWFEISSGRSHRRRLGEQAPFQFDHASLAEFFASDEGDLSFVAVRLRAAADS